MNTKNILFSLSIALFLLLSFNLVSADKTVDYNVYYGIIENNATLTTSTTAVNDFDATIYNCTSANCSTVGNIITEAHTNTNVLSIVFPEILQSQYGYLIYVHKDGYIGWEQRNVIRYGNGTNVSSSVFYLSKKRSGWAPIMNLSVKESVKTNQPIRVGFNVSIDADTYSAIEKATHSNLALEETVRTIVDLQVSGANGTVYHTNKILNIPYSGYIPVEFEIPGFNQTGNYEVVLTTNLDDEKFLDTKQQAVGSFFTVISGNLLNYTYTLINNIRVSPALPRYGDVTNFSFSYLSGYIDGFGSYFPANTTIMVAVYNETGGVYYTLNDNLGSSGDYTFNVNFNKTGQYVVWITGSPNDTRGNLSLPSSQAMTFIINDNKNGSNGNDTDDDDDHHNHEQTVDNSGTPGKLKFGDSLPLSLGSKAVLDLAPQTKTFNYKLLIYWLIWILLLLIILIVLVYILKYPNK